jgi:hypothetical protein
MAQQYERVNHTPTVAECRRAGRDTWFRIPAHDRVATARIEVSVLLAPWLTRELSIGSTPDAGEARVAGPLDAHCGQPGFQRLALAC